MISLYILYEFTYVHATSLIRLQGVEKNHIWDPLAQSKILSKVCPKMVGLPPIDGNLGKIMIHQWMEWLVFRKCPHDFQTTPR